MKLSGAQAAIATVTPSPPPLFRRASQPPGPAPSSRPQKARLSRVPKASPRVAVLILPVGGSVISKRGLFAAAATGAGAALLFSGAAFASDISDFSVTPVASCDTSSGVAKAAITVTDKDSSGTPAHITVGPHMASSLPGPVLDQWDFPHPTAAGVSHTFYVDWKPGAQWDVRVTAGSIRDEPITPYPTSADKPCTVPSSAPSKTPMPSNKPTSSAAPAPTSSTTAAGSAPAPAASASTQGTSLAKTGGGSDSGMIAGIAGALIVIGGGALFTVQRRKAAARH